MPIQFLLGWKVWGFFHLAVEQTASSRIKYIGEITKKTFALPSPIFSYTGGTLLFALEENMNGKEMKMDTSQCFKNGSTDAKKHISGKSSVNQQEDLL